MVSPVKSRLTHYDNLGLTPAATSDEIAEAFAKQIRITITSPEEAVEHATSIYVAYETLRDPVKRSAYDAAIGLWDRKAAAELKAEPFIGAMAHASPDALHDALPAGASGPVKTERRPARRTSKAGIEWPVPESDRKVLNAAVERKTSPARPGMADPISEELRAQALNRAAQARSVPASHDASPGGTPRPANNSGKARQANKAAVERQAGNAAARERPSSAGLGTGLSGREKIRGNTFNRADRRKSVPASHQARTNRNSAGAGAGVIIAAFGMLTLVVALVRGNYDQIPRAPRPQIAMADQKPVQSTGRTTATEEQAVPVDQIGPQVADEAVTPATRPMLRIDVPRGRTDLASGEIAVTYGTSQADGAVETGQPALPKDGGEASSFSSAEEPAEQVREESVLAGDTQPSAHLRSGTPLEEAVDQQAIGTEFEQAADAPPSKSVPRPIPATAPQQVVSRQAAHTPPRQPVSRQASLTQPSHPVPRPVARSSSQRTVSRQVGAPAQQVVYRQAARTPPQQPVVRRGTRTSPRQTLSAQPGPPVSKRVYQQTAHSSARQAIYRHAPRTLRPHVRYRQIPAKWLAGALVNSDNPGGRFHGTVYVQFTVQTNGRVTGCRATSSHLNRALEARTCRLVERRLLFSPALDSLGRRIPSILRTTYTWGRVV